MNIYRKDCAVKIPFLRADCVDAEALFSEERDSFELDATIKALYGEDLGESEVSFFPFHRATWQQRAFTSKVACCFAMQMEPKQNLFMTNSIENLARILSYHEVRTRLEPMRAKELEQSTKMVSELTNTLKTIFMI